MRPPYYMGIETGGTKILCRIVDTAGKTIAERRWPTTSPAAALEAIVQCARETLPGSRPTCAGLASFGPVMLDPMATNFGTMLATPKAGWEGSNLAVSLRRRLECSVIVDTDVNAAALAEQHMGIGRGMASVAYLTIGTGIGGGLALNGKTLRGGLHPEIGHVRLVRQKGDMFESMCPFHEDCAEGLAAGPAVHYRLAAALGSERQVFQLVARYLAQLLASVTLFWSPHRIVLGGGVLVRPGLIEAIKEAFEFALQGYGTSAPAPADRIFAASLDNAGLEGAVLMARSSAAQ